jgi:hypothetical protein
MLCEPTGGVLVQIAWGLDDGDPASDTGAVKALNAYTAAGGASF